MSSVVNVSSEERDALYKFAFQKQALSDSTKETLGGAGIGALLGAGMGLWNHLDTPQDEDEPKLKRILSHVLGGAALGGVAGAGLGYLGVPGAVRGAAKSMTAVDAPKDDRPRSESYREAVDKALDSDPAKRVYTGGRRALLWGAGGATGYNAVERFLNMLGEGWFKSRGGKILNAQGKDLNFLRRDPAGTIGTWWHQLYKPSIDAARKGFMGGKGEYAALKELAGYEHLLDAFKKGDWNARKQLIGLAKKHDLKIDDVVKGRHSAYATAGQKAVENAVKARSKVNAMANAKGHWASRASKAMGKTGKRRGYGTLITAALSAALGAMTAGSGQKPVSAGSASSLQD